MLCLSAFALISNLIMHIDCALMLFLFIMPILRCTRVMLTTLIDYAYCAFYGDYAQYAYGVNYDYGIMLTTLRTHTDQAYMCYA